ncbi:sporulation-specific diadenylate cyclase CdaS [Lederbergia panacisoli]|uniref:sporulation-specific diadenylate cyclase CdaS n=1 Tax=Lederbergia panacisoli TaxID=1255251 RepID=UPI00214CA143|nr:sporulation-specific diadenylate cyclase CdaS [Lederbergia panacisoli]MCR2823196.1 sporulation-specific diadenylate cyclase CdaS [Lederbergia panacisoli]
MNNTNCDFSPMKQTIKDEIRQVISGLQSILGVMDQEDNCLLGSFEKIKENFITIDMKAASFYLNCYLAPFTDKYHRRHGGLIVIQREDSLEPLIRPGIPIRAELTHSLLESIFFPGNPLHDGAVMVNANQIVSAANVLPLSDKFVGDKKLGTRHRAALGLSEQSDALVLVVSEETGRVSFGFNGNLYPVNTGQYQ